MQQLQIIQMIAPSITPNGRESGLLCSPAHEAEPDLELLLVLYMGHQPFQQFEVMHFQLLLGPGQAAPEDNPGYINTC